MSIERLANLVPQFLAVADVPAQELAVALADKRLDRLRPHDRLRCLELARQLAGHAVHLKNAYQVLQASAAMDGRTAIALRNREEEGFLICDLATQQTTELRGWNALIEHTGRKEKTLRCMFSTGRGVINMIVGHRRVSITRHRDVARVADKADRYAPPVETSSSWLAARQAQKK